MSQPKTAKPSTPDTLTKAGKGADIELSENDLNKVTGGQKHKADTSDYLVVTLKEAFIS
jgi:bacteriocin-like protein